MTRWDPLLQFDQSCRCVCACGLVDEKGTSEKGKVGGCIFAVTWYIVSQEQVRRLKAPNRLEGKTLYFCPRSVAKTVIEHSDIALFPSISQLNPPTCHFASLSFADRLI